MSPGGTVGATLTGGIQDIAALLPLLGTEQCEDHISSALTKGYLYVAATPLSIFGCLGMARAGLKTFVAGIAIPKRGIVGAQILSDMGFKPQGTNLSLIMIGESHKDHRYLVESHLDDLLKELHIDSTKEVQVARKCAKWNVAMITLTAFACLLSIVPYIYVNVKGESDLRPFTRWTFPALRAIGGFLTATMMQLIIQIRITTLCEKLLRARRHDSYADAAAGDPVNQPDVHQSAPSVTVKRNEEHADKPPSRSTSQLAGYQGSPRDLEEGLRAEEGSIPTQGSSKQDAATANENSLLTWCYLVLLVVGVLSLVVGYIGCFSIVQSERTLSGPISWLCLESGLSIIRMILWGLNPTSDDAPPLELVLTLDKHPPLLTCIQYDNEIREEKTLLLTRAPQFLESITSFAGPIKRFDSPDLTLYYTLTRKNVTISEKLATPGRPGERVLYITIFDHKERTTRVYTRDSHGNHFYSTQSDIPSIDLRHDLLDIRLGEEIDPDNDPVAGDRVVQFMLTSHYQSIMDQIHFTFGQQYAKHEFVIRNNWTMDIGGTKNPWEWQTDEQQGEDAPGGRKLVVEKGKVNELNGEDISFNLDCQFLEQGRLERMRRLLIVARGKWIEDYMTWVTSETRDNVAMKDISHRADGVRAQGLKDEGKVEDPEAIEESSEMIKDKESTEMELLLVAERYQMEMLLVDEVARWEEQLLDKMRTISNELGSDRMIEKKRLIKMWSSNCWRRLDTDRRAMDARMSAANDSLSMEANSERSLSQPVPWKDKWLQEIREAWRSVIGQYVNTSGSSLSFPPPHSPPSLSHRLDSSLAKYVTSMGWRLESFSEEQKERCWAQQKVMEKRLRRELEDVESRLEQGLDHCNEFWGDRYLFDFRYSPCKWLVLNKQVCEAPLEVYAHELNRRKDLIFVGLGEFRSDDDAAWIVNAIQGIPSVTSILLYFGRKLDLPSIQENHSLLSISGDFHSTPDIRLVLDRNRARLEQSSYTIFTFVGTEFGFGTDLQCRIGSTIAVSFVGPTSGTLRLRLIFSSQRQSGILTVKGSFTFELPIPSSRMVHDIILHPSTPDYLSFEPSARNELTLTVTSGMNYLRDIQLLDEEGRPYNPRIDFDTSISNLVDIRLSGLELRQGLGTNESKQLQTE